MDTQKRLHEKISALVDGELPLADAELAFAALDTPAGWSAWNAYHQIGHTLRSSPFGAELSAGFQARLARRLAQAASAEAAGGASAPSHRAGDKPSPVVADASPAESSTDDAAAADSGRP